MSHTFARFSRPEPATIPKRTRAVIHGGSAGADPDAATQHAAAVPTGNSNDAASQPTMAVMGGADTPHYHHRGSNFMHKFEENPLLFGGVVLAIGLWAYIKMKG
jgi:hypothetical protein